MDFLYELYNNHRKEGGGLRERKEGSIIKARKQDRRVVWIYMN